MKQPTKNAIPGFFRRINWLPAASAAGLVLLAFALHFNGLYGQDAHEYLRLSRAYFQHFQGIEYVPEGRGDAAFGVGYPLAGALLQFLGLGAAQGLQAVSALTAGAALWLFDGCLRALSAGAHRWSRWLYAGVALAGSAYFVRAGLSAMSDALGLALALGAFRYGLRAVERRHGRDAVWAAVFAGLAVLTRFSLAALMLPLAAGVAWAFRRRRREWGWLAGAIGAGLLTLAPHFLLKMNVPASPFAHSLLQGWSPLNLFRAEFSNANGTVDYGWPNLLYALFPLAHPGFLLPLPLLFLMAKKTDFLLPAKRVALGCLSVYLFFLGGVPHQNLRYLLPAYALLLLLLFPAWDRFVSYGLYFFKKITLGLLALGIVSQVYFTVKILTPVVARNRLENEAAGRVKKVVPAGAFIFAFDLDIALKSYLPEMRFQNLWERRYGDFPPGSFILFNEPRLRGQWQGRNPMLNWDFAVQNFDLREAAALPGGWVLYEVAGRK